MKLTINNIVMYFLIAVQNEWKPCIQEIHSITSCFMFSVEMQTLIYYGVRATTEECPQAIIMTCTQLMFGVVSQVFMVSIFFTKMTHSKKRTQTLLFSKHAVICMHKNSHCLLFRVGDMRTSHILSPKVRVRLLKTRITKQGEKLFQSFNELKVGTTKHSGDIFLNWPMTVIHKIDGYSPLHTVHANNISKLSFELIVTLEGVIESTGQKMQAKTSYINTEILWGYEFQPITTYNKDINQFESDFSNFHKTVQVETMTPYSAFESDLCFTKSILSYSKSKDRRNGKDYGMKEPTNRRNTICLEKDIHLIRINR